MIRASASDSERRDKTRAAQEEAFVIRPALKFESRGSMMWEIQGWIQYHERFGGDLPFWTSSEAVLYSSGQERQALGDLTYWFTSCWLEDFKSWCGSAKRNKARNIPALRPTSLRGSRGSARGFSCKNSLITLPFSSGSTEAGAGKKVSNMIKYVSNETEQATSSPWIPNTPSSRNFGIALASSFSLYEHAILLVTGCRLLVFPDWYLQGVGRLPPLNHPLKNQPMDIYVMSWSHQNLPNSVCLRCWVPGASIALAQTWDSLHAWTPSDGCHRKQQNGKAFPGFVRFCMLLIAFVQMQKPSCHV